MLVIGVQNGGKLEIWTNYYGKGEKFIGCDINQVVMPCSSMTILLQWLLESNTDKDQEEILSHNKVLEIVIDNYFVRLL